MRGSLIQSLLNRLPDKKKDLIDNAEGYHRRAKENPSFGGPSLHFHHRALDRRPIEDRVEAIYAVLASWGMHRLGTGGPKMKDFAEFRKAILDIQDEVAMFAGVTYCIATNDQVDRLVNLASSFKVMRTGTWLVASSKVLAHLLPDLVAPIDREYTLGYLTGGKGSFVAPTHEEALFRTITVQFYWEVAKDPRFNRVAHSWVRTDPASWDTSLLKVVDNLVIEARTEQRAAMKEH